MRPKSSSWSITQRNISVDSHFRFPVIPSHSKWIKFIGNFKCTIFVGRFFPLKLVRRKKTHSIAVFVFFVWTVEVEVEKKGNFRCRGCVRLLIKNARRDLMEINKIVFCPCVCLGVAYNNIMSSHDYTECTANARVWQQIEYINAMNVLGRVTDDDDDDNNDNNKQCVREWEREREKLWKK